MTRLVLLAALVSLPLAAQRPTYVVPELPRVQVDTTFVASAGRTIRVPAGDNAALQAALDTALGGDQIVLPNAARFTGAFRLRRTAVVQSRCGPRRCPPARSRSSCRRQTLRTLFSESADGLVAGAVRLAVGG